MRLAANPARLVALLALALAALLSPAPAARAQAAGLAISPASAPQNSRVSLSLSGFAAQEPISLWLTRPDYTTVALGDLSADAAGAATLELRLGVELPVGRHTVSARGNLSGRLASAALELTAAAGAPASPGVTLRVAQERLPQGECFSFNGAGYRPGELIAVWLRLPDGAVSSDGLEGEVAADASGGIGYQLCFGRLAAEGRYAFSAYGRASGRTGIAEFGLRRGDYLGAPAGDAVLFVDPPRARQLETVALVGGGFSPGERVSLWLTLPNGVVLDLFSGRSEDGTFLVELSLPALPVGSHSLSAYGQSSGERAVATLELLPGDGR